MTLPVAGIAFLAVTPARPPVVPAPAAMRFAGHWEVVHGRADGRFGGASARSFHAGDVLELHFGGSGFKVFGVTGPAGGHAVVVVAGQPDTKIDFYAVAKHTHVLLYDCTLPFAGEHSAAVIVTPQHDAASHGNYVNIDSVEVIP